MITATESIRDRRRLIRIESDRRLVRPTESPGKTLRLSREHQDHGPDSRRVTKRPGGLPGPFLAIVRCMCEADQPALARRRSPVRGPGEVTPTSTERTLDHAGQAT